MMKKRMTSILMAGTIAFLVSCNKDTGSVSYTYNKATAQYENLEQLRNQPLSAPVRGIKDPGKIFIGENFLLIGEKDVGIHVFNNTNRSSPSNVSFINLPYSSEFYVKDNFVYAEAHYDFVKIDISNLSNPVLVNREENAFSVPIMNDKGEALVGFSYTIATESFKLNSKEAAELQKTQSLYFNYKNELIPESEVPSSFAGNDNGGKGTLNKIAVHNNHVYVVGNSEIHTFSDNPSGVQYLNSNTISNNIETIYPEGNFLYIGTNNSMEIVDASSPASPIPVSTYSHPISCDPVYPNGNEAYVTLRTADNGGCEGDVNALHVVDISNKNQPKEKQVIEMKSPYGMAVIDNKLFVGEGSNGMKILDVNSKTLLANHTNIVAFDILEHPSDPNLILITGFSGLEQYVYTSATNQLQKLSTINY